MLLFLSRIVKKLSILFIFLFYVLAQGKDPEAKLINIDASNYPEIKAEFELINYEGNGVRLFEQSEILCYDGGLRRTIEEVMCGEAEPTKFSAILVIDRSMSMERPIGGVGPQTCSQLVREVVDDWIDKMDPSRSETALLSFANSSNIISEFSTNKSSLKKAVGNLGELQSYTNYNAVFICDKFGDSSRTVFAFARKAKYRPVVIFLTDGKHESQDGKSFQATEAYQLAKENNAYIFVVKISNEDIGDEDLNVLKYLSTVFGKEEDNLHLNVQNKEALYETYDFIREKAGNLGEDPYCYVKWLSDCDGGDNVYLRFSRYLDVETERMNYEIPEDRKPYLEIDPGVVEIWVDNLDEEQEADVMIKAKNRAAKVDGVNLSGNDFDVDIAGGELDIAKDASKSIKVKFSARDSLYREEDVVLSSDACDGLEFKVYGVLKPKTAKIDMGKAVVGGAANERIIEELMWNYTGRDLKINSVKIKGANADDFTVLEPAGELTVADNGSLRVKFSFEPSDLGSRTGSIEIEYNDGMISQGEISGVGEGTAGISSVNPFRFDHTDCRIEVIDSTITLRNTGAEDLVISSIEITEGSEYFELGDYESTIDKMSEIEVGLKFISDAISGEKRGKMKVVSNSADNPEYTIDIIGRRDAISFESDSYEIDLGNYCKGEVLNGNIDIRATGDRGIELQLSGSDINFESDELFVEVGESGSLSFTFDVSAEIDGKVSREIVVRDEYCGESKTYTVRANYYEPRIDESIEVKISGALGLEHKSTIEIENISNNELDISDLYLIESEHIKIGDVGTQKTLQPGEKLTVELIYKTNLAGTVYDTLKVVMEPCNTVNSIVVMGSSALSVATLKAGEARGIIGETVSIALDLTDKGLFKASGTNKVTTKVRYEEGILDYLGTYVSKIGGSIYTVMDIEFDVEETDEDQTNVAILEFKIKAGNQAWESVIGLESTKSNMNNVEFVEEAGKIYIDKVNCKLAVADYKAKPGESFKLEIVMNDVEGLDSEIHEGLEYKVKYRANILERVNYDAEEEIVDGYRISEMSMDFTDNIHEGMVVGELDLRAMLGSELSSEIEIIDVNVKNGIVYTDVDNGSFELEGLCMNGGPRLYAVEGYNALGVISPQPAVDFIDINFSVKEEKETRILLYNSLGKLERVLYEAVPDMGDYSIRVSVKELESGVYYVVMKTPTRTFSKSIVVKK